MIISTTPNIDGHKITKYCGVIAGEAILGANLFGVDLDYEVLGQGNGMLMVSASGTAVLIQPVRDGA